MKTILLASVSCIIACLAVLSSGQGQEQAVKCETPDGTELQSHLDLIHVFYLELRDIAARGGTYQKVPLGKGGQMYALIRNNTLFGMAEREIKKRFLNPRKYGLFRVEGEYRNRYSPIDDLAKLLKTNEAVKEQMIYPNATQYACTLQVFRNNSSNVCQQKVLCILDKKAPANYQITGKACNRDRDCTYIRPAVCLSPLCYTY